VDAVAHVTADGGMHMLAWSFGTWLLWTLALIVWIAIAFWPARVAARKGHSFFGYFILSLFFFPLALILAYVVQDRTGTMPA
jgi:hypothetical protein